jgi:hypothetical protein
MASTILSSTSYLNYLNDYINILLKSTDRYIIEHLNEKYFDEIETSARLILAQWHSEQILDQQSSFYIENVGYLNRKIGLLSQLYPFQFQRIKNLLFNPEMIQLLTLIIQSLIERDSRHEDNFLRYLSIFFDAYSSIKDSKLLFNQLTQQAIQSKYYKQYLIEIISSNIESKHLFFIGAIGQLAEPKHSSTLNQFYSQFLQKFYPEKYVSIDLDVQYCTLGILSQFEISYLINDYTCISTLVSIFLNENIKIFRLPILILLNSICIQSKTVACYLNTNQLIDILLQYVPKQTNCLIHMNACLLLGHLISEKQLLKLRISYKLTMKFMDLLIDYKQERNNILLSLLSLSIHEEIQSIIAQTYQLKDLIELSKDYSIMNEIIWKLSFHSEIIEQLIQRHDDYLKELSTNNGIIENIRMKNLSRTPRTTGISSDITLIFSSKDQLVVQQIKDDLLKNNFRIGTLSDSLYVLLCISEDSKHDCSCQAAIRQALLECKKLILCIVQKPYRIDDWFSKLHIQEKNPLNIIESGVEKLSSEIRKDLHQLPATTKKTRIITPSETTFTLSPPPVVSPVIPKKKIQTWTNREVLEWCVTNKLSPFTKILTHYDGRNLLSLAHLSRMSTPHTIINQLRNDCRKQGLRLSFVEFVRFQTALDELLRLEKNIARKQSISTLANRYVYAGKTINQN